MSKSDKHVIFLMCAVLLASARPRIPGAPALDLHKQRRLRDLLGEHYAQLSPAQRQALLARTLRSMPPLSGGLSFLSLIERSSQKVKATLTSPREAFALLKQLGSIAQAGDGPVSRQELLVLQAVNRHLGLQRRVMVSQAQDGRLQIART